jgi:hypothetical protein
LLVEHCAKPIESRETSNGNRSTINDDDASSTSSCSCEDHSSIAGHSDDPHGDLDYDDDDDNTSNRREPSNSGTTDLQRSPKERVTDDIEAKPDRKQSNDQSTKIRSFINLDHRQVEAKRSSKDRPHKSYETLLKYFFKDACYFQIKSINYENVALAKSMGIWSTPIRNEVRLNAAFREHKNVILIFSVQQSGAFQGFARMVSEARPPSEPVPWILPERLSSAALGGVFRIEWLCTKELNFNETRDIYNAFNNNKPVKVARDGQQVEPKSGRKLCMLFPKDSKKRLIACIETLKIQSRRFSRNSYYPYHPYRRPR